MTSRALVVLLLLSCACSDDTGGVSIPVSVESLYGLWQTRDEEGVERVMSFVNRDDYVAMTSGRRDVSAICLDGVRVQSSAFSVEEGHIVQEVLEDADPANVGLRFGTEVFAFDGTTLELESASAPSGRRTWTKVARHTPRASTGWLVVDAPAPPGTPAPLGSTDIAWDADGDWHLVTSYQRDGTRLPGGVYATRKNTCELRRFDMPGSNQSSLTIHDGTLHAWINRFDDYVTLATRAVGNNLTNLVGWQEEPIDGLSYGLPGSFGIDADGTQRVVRRDGTNGGATLWRRKPGSAWVSTQLPDEPAGKVVFDREGRLHYLSGARLVSEAADGTFGAEDVTTGEANGSSPADLAFAPDGSLRVVSGARGIEVFTKESGAWTSTRLTRTPTTVAFEIDQGGVHHFWSRTLRPNASGVFGEDQLQYVRWDGTTVTRELPIPERAPSLSYDRPFVRLGPAGEVGLNLGSGAVAIWSPDAAAHRRSVTLTIAKEGEGTVTIEGQAGACGDTCVFVVPAGAIVRMVATPAYGYVIAGRYDHEEELTEDGSTSASIPIGASDQQLNVIFRRSQVLRVVRPEPANMWFQNVDAGAGGAVAVASSKVAWTLGASSLEAGRFLGALDDDGAWIWARPFTDAVVVAALHRMTGGDLALMGTFEGTIDIGTGPITATPGQSDGLVARFAADGTPVFVRHLSAVMRPFALTGLGDSVVIAAQFQSAIELDGQQVEGGAELLVSFASDGSVLATGVFSRASAQGSGANLQVVLAASDDRVFVAGPAFGLPGASVEGTANRIAAYGPDLRRLWTRLPFVPGLDRIAVDADGQVHGYGPTMGGDYGGGELPDPRLPGRTDGFVHVVLGADGSYVSGRVSLGYDNRLVVFQAMTSERFFSLAERPPLLISHSAVPVPGEGTFTRGGTWLGGDRYRVYAIQSGFADWTITSGTYDGAVIVDGRY